MTTINTLLEEFDDTFVADGSGEACQGWLLAHANKLYDKSNNWDKIAIPNDVKQFIRTSFTKYNSELAAKVEALMPPVIVDIADEARYALLTKVLDLLKEGV